MQTPASMEKSYIIIFILLILIINRFFVIICVNMFYAFSFLLYIFLLKTTDGNNLYLNKESLFKLVKKYETDSKFNHFKNFESFRELSNGIFQAEGHIGGSLRKIINLDLLFI